MQHMALRISLRTPTRHQRHKHHLIPATLRIRMRRIALRRPPPVAEIPYKRFSSPSILEPHRIRRTTRHRRHKLRHRKIIRHIEPEQRIIAIRRPVHLAPRTSCHRKIAKTATRRTHRLVQRRQLVEPRRPTVHMIAAPAEIIVRTAMRLAEKRRILQMLAVLVDRQNIEILPVRRITPRTRRRLHPRRSQRTPPHIAVTHKITPPPRSIHPVAHIRSKSRRRQIDPPRRAEQRTPLSPAQIRQQPHQQHTTVHHTITRIIHEIAIPRRLRLPEHKHLVPSTRTHKIQLVVPPQPNIRHPHQTLPTIRNLTHKTIRTTAPIRHLPRRIRHRKIHTVRTTAHQQIIIPVHIHRIHSIIPAAAKIRTPQQIAQIIVQLEHHTVLAATAHSLQAPPRRRKISRHRRRTHIHIVQIIRHNLTPRTVAVIVIQRIVPLHQHTIPVIIIPLEIQTVITRTPHQRRRLQPLPVSTQPAHKNITPVRIPNRRRLITQTTPTPEHLPIRTLRRRKIGRTRRTEHQQLIKPVYIQTVRHIRRPTAQIRRKQTLLTRRVELEHTHIHTSARHLLIRTRRHRITHIEHQTRRIRILLRIIRRRRTPIVRRRTRIRRKNQHRIHHQLSPAVILTDLNPRPAALHTPPARHLDLLTLNHLIRIRTQLRHIAHRRTDHQTPTPVNPQPVNTLILNHHHTRISTRRNNKIILQRTLLAIHLQIHTLIQTPVPHHTKRTHPGTPTTRILAQKKITIPTQQTLPLRTHIATTHKHHPVRMITHRPHTHSRMTHLAPQRHSHTPALRKHSTTRNLRLIANTAVPLTRILDKRHPPATLHTLAPRTQAHPEKTHQKNENQNFI